MKERDAMIAHIDAIMEHCNIDQLDFIYVLVVKLAEKLGVK